MSMALNVRRFPVEVFTESMLLHGYLETARRLTDLANEGEPYITLHEIETYPYSGTLPATLSRHDRGLVNRDAIVLLAERDMGGPDVTGIEGMQIIKVAHRILVHTNFFAISADIHVPVSADIEDFLKASPGQFVPVTDANATPIVPGTQLTGFERHFMLINRDHIAYLGTAEKSVVVATPATSGTTG